MTRSITISLPSEMADCLDWLVGHEQSTDEHILLALLNHGFLTVADGIRNDDYELMADALQVAMKRYFRAEAPEIWAKRRRV